MIWQLSVVDQGAENTADDRRGTADVVAVAEDARRSATAPRTSRWPSSVSSNFAIRAFVTAADLRLDGMLRAKAKPSQPGVAISFTCKHGPLTYPCDTYEQWYSGVTPGWQANVRAIALSLQALRAVERHGVGGRGEQYAGWKAIESGQANGFDSVDEAIVWLRDFVIGHDGIVPAGDRALLKRASRIAHPDAGGDPADWNRIDAARQLLEREGRGLVQPLDDSAGGR